MISRGDKTRKNSHTTFDARGPPVPKHIAPADRRYSKISVYSINTCGPPHCSHSHVHDDRYPIACSPGIIPPRQHIQQNLLPSNSLAPPGPGAPRPVVPAPPPGGSLLLLRYRHAAVVAAMLRHLPHHVVFDNDITTTPFSVDELGDTGAVGVLPSAAQDLLDLVPVPEQDFALSAGRKFVFEGAERAEQDMLGVRRYRRENRGSDWFCDGGGLLMFVGREVFLVLLVGDRCRCS